MGEDNTPVYGCNSCNMTIGRAGCLEHSSRFRVLKNDLTPNISPNINRHCPTCKCVNVQTFITSIASIGYVSQL